MNNKLKNKVRLVPVEKKDLALFKKELRDAFVKGVIDSFGDAESGPVPPDEAVQQSINAPGAVVYHISLNGKNEGGVVLKIDDKTHRNSVELLFISSKSHGRGIGTAAWQAIETQYPETRVWELVTPYFEKRNIHFYVNKCRFHIVEFYCKSNPGPHRPRVNEMQNDPAPLKEHEFFRFEKTMKR